MAENLSRLTGFSLAAKRVRAAEEKRNFRLTCESGRANVALRMTETRTPRKTFWPLDKRLQPVELTEDQRRTMFFAAVGNEAGNLLSDEKNPYPFGAGEYVKPKV